MQVVQRISSDAGSESVRREGVASFPSAAAAQTRLRCAQYVSIDIPLCLVTHYMLTKSSICRHISLLYAANDFSSDAHYNYCLLSAAL